VGFAAMNREWFGPRADAAVLVSLYFSAESVFVEQQGLPDAWGVLMQDAQGNSAQVAAR
jgi:hypothetical protein